jgi:hypothetical protein
MKHLDKSYYAIYDNDDIVVDVIRPDQRSLITGEYCRYLNRDDFCLQWLGNYYSIVIEGLVKQINTRNTRKGYRSTRLSEEVKATALRLHEQGCSNRYIAQKLNVSHTAINKLVKSSEMET